MTKTSAVGAGLGAVLLGVLAIIAFWSGSGPRQVIPAAIGQPGSESEGSATGPDDVTRHPILVLPSISGDAKGADSSSPAAGSARPTGPAEPAGASDRPDSLFPRTSFLPDPEHLNALPAPNDMEQPTSWPDGRPIRVPGDDWGTSPSGERPVPLDHPVRPPRWQPRR
jgi:hypothetical protein